MVKVLCRRGGLSLDFRNEVRNWKITVRRVIAELIRRKRERSK